VNKKIIFFICFSFFLPCFLFGQYFFTPRLLLPFVQNAPEIGSRAAVLIDAQTGALLYSRNPDEEIPPASLTKLMSLHLAMREIEEGRASYEEIVPVTVESWAQSQPPRSSLMFLAPGQTVTLREIMLGLAVPSGNDAAVALALRFAPTMDDFARMMTQEARRMGLNVTRFVESSGISEFNMTTAAEFAYFCRQYIKLHPYSLREFHSAPVFSYPMAHNVPEAYRSNPRTITQENRNNLLKTFPGVDGIKTGFIDESGYNIALTAQRNGTRFIAVILGAPAEPNGIRVRDSDGSLLLSWAFDNFKTVRAADISIKNERLWKGKENEVELIIGESADFTSPIDRANTLIFETVIPNKLIAPLPAGFPVGYLSISDEWGELNRVPVITAYSYEQGNFFKRVWHSILLFFRK